MDEGSGHVVVRPFAAKDAEAVVAMMKALAAFHGDDALATAPDLMRFASGADRVSTIHVASVDGELCGFSATYDGMDYVQGVPVRHIDLFFVEQSRRGCGVGRALLVEIARAARASACRRLTVGAEQENEGAKAFYEAMGFEIRRPSSQRYALSGEALDRLTIA